MHSNNLTVMNNVSESIFWEVGSPDGTGISNNINLFYRQLVCHQCLSQDPHLESGDTDLPFSRSGEIAEALPIEHVASDRGPLGPEI